MLGSQHTGLGLSILGASVLVAAIGLMSAGQLLGQQAGGDAAPGWFRGLLASGLFVLYVDKSGGYAETYGVLGGVVVLLLWLQITASVLLLGAELNRLLEHPAPARPRQKIGRAPASRDGASRRHDRRDPHGSPDHCSPPGACASRDAWPPTAGTAPRAPTAGRTSR